MPNPGSCSEAQKNYIEKPSCFNSEGGIKLIRKSGTYWGEIPSLRNQNEQDKERDDFEDLPQHEDRNRTYQERDGKD